MGKETRKAEEKDEKKEVRINAFCKHFGHRMRYSTSGLAGYCTRKGCDYYWEYD